MDAYIFDTSFNLIKILDNYESFIWTERYSKCGDFEIYLPFELSYLDFIQRDNYVGIRDSDTLMIIESIAIETDIDNGNHLTVSGRTLGSILDRRIIWDQTILNTTLQNGVKTLLNQSIISPSVSARRISNFVFNDSSDTYILAQSIKAQYTGDNLYDVITEIAEAYSIGWRVRLNNSNQFVFELYNGVDRSYNQDANSYVVFSPNYENLYGSNYKESTDVLRTVTLVAGEGEGASRKTATVYTDNGSTLTGMARRELYTDARDISSDTESGTLSDSEYQEQLQQRGKEKLGECTESYYFDGEVDTTTTMYTMNQDYFIGDIVQIRNEYGLESAARVTEFIRTQDENGYAEYPSFEIV